MKKKLILFTLLTVIVSACGDKFFDVTPTDRYSDVSFWKTERDYTLAINGIYSYLQGASSPGNTSDAQFATGGIIDDESMSDNAFHNRAWTTQYKVGNGSHSAIDFQPGVTGVYLIWYPKYEGIRRANTLLNRITDISFTSKETKSRIIAEARFLRAYLYFDLAFKLGNVPLITTEISIEEGQTPVQSPRKEVIDFVLAELEAASNDLPNSYTGADIGRITKGAALGFRARFALYAAGILSDPSYYTIARDAAKAVMDLNVYSLIDSYESLFSYANENSTEVILSNQFVAPNRVHNLWGTYAPPSLGGAAQVSPILALQDAYETTNGLPITNPLSGYIPSDPYANRDPRLDMSILRPGSVFAGRTIHSTKTGDQDYVGANAINSSYTGLFIKKYLVLEDRATPTISGLNVILMRYAEILLTYAEAKIELNEIDASVYDALNATRNRADVNMPPYTVLQYPDQASLREALRRERRVELAFEGHRFFDIRRWKIAEIVMNAPVHGADYEDGPNAGNPVFVENRVFNPSRDYLFGIPPNEVSLSKLQQNPGY